MIDQTKKIRGEIKMDNMEKSDWDELAFRLSKFVKIDSKDNFEDVKAKLKNTLKNDKRGSSLLEARSWKQLWREVVPRLMNQDGLKAKLYTDRGGKEKGYAPDRRVTAQKVVTDFNEFERLGADKVDMDGLDTKDGKFIKNGGKK